MTAVVELAGVSKSYHELLIADSINLRVAPGEFLTLLGPSGCGKTTTLRMIAGFEHPDSGHIFIEGREVTGLPAYKRRVNTVFQHYALFPHLTIYENLAYGLRRKGVPPEDLRQKVARGLEMIHLQGHEKKLPSQLSGGQKQRVAMARALVCEPLVLLLDEPMSALDVKLRREMQLELKRLHRQLGLTFIFVTHDQEEALVMSDRIAVMNRGRLEQVGSAEEVYDRPRTPFVADFLGVKNFFEATLEGEKPGGRFLWRTAAGLELLTETAGSASAGEVRKLGVRPENLECGGKLPAELANRFPGRIVEVLYTGSTTTRRVAVDGSTQLETLSASRVGLDGGEQVELGFDSKSVLVLEPPAPES